MIIDPDEYSDRHSDPPEAFAAAARLLREKVLLNPKIRKVHVMVGPPGSGKSTYAREHDADNAAYIDGCHANAKTRRALAKRIREHGKTPIAVYVATPLAEALRRNNTRDGPRRVPPQVVRRMAKELEKRPPRDVEGWHEVVVVQ